jgi:hypothetical protein
MANELRAASGLNFVALQLTHRKPGAWLKSVSAPTDWHEIQKFFRPNRRNGTK